MIRRLTALFLVVACAFALALPAHETSDLSTQMECCCGDGPSTCGQRDCIPAPSAPSARVTQVASAVEQQAPTAKPVAGVSRDGVAALVSFFLREQIATSARRVVAAASLVPLSSGPLFQAHCSLLI